MAAHVLEQNATAGRDKDPEVTDATTLFMLNENACRVGVGEEDLRDATSLSIFGKI